MRRLIALLFLCVSINAVGQRTVTFPAPETIATKAEIGQKIDSLAKVLRSEITNGSPGGPVVPGQKDCKHSLTLVSVSKQTTAGAEYNFYSVGVDNLIEVIYNQEGKEVFRHRTEKVTKDRIWIPYSLPPGNYRLIISNADCKAVSQPVAFTIPGAGDREEPTVPVETGFDNKGVYRERIGSILYEWIPSEHADITVANGLVRIQAPETKTSYNGAAKCKRFLIADLYDNRLPESEEKALFGDGLALPPGQYHFKILYTAARSWSELLANKWHFLGTDGNAEQRAAQPETVIISVSDGKAIQGISADQWRASWTPQFFRLDEGLRLPEDKIFGPTRYMATLDHSRITRNATHIQNPGGVFNYLGPNYWWFNLQARPGTRQPDQVIRESPVSPRFVAMSELAENYGNDENDCPRCYDKAENVLKGLFGRAQREYGAKTPYDTWLVSDYFSPMYGGSIDGGFFSEGATASIRSEGLSSIKLARSFRQKLRWYESGYFSNGWYNYRNFMAAGYLDNLFTQAGGQSIYGRVYQLEKAGLALSDRKKIVYITPQQEGLGFDYMSSTGTTYRVPVAGGEIIRHEAFIQSFTTFQTESFFSLLFGNGLLIWDSNLALNEDPETFRPSWWGGYEEWKTKWKFGGKIITYNENGSGQPKQKQASGQFPDRPSVSEQGAYVGAKLYESLGPVTSATWADYELNGKQVVAKRGNDGTSRANVAGIQNPGQDNIVLAHENQLPIVLHIKSQTGQFIVYQNPGAGLTAAQTIKCEGRYFKATGNRLHIFRI